ncbi:hypothetical protein [uncultured Sunxiuqinia sp.]|uniref:hypothetical protein n=1 Tax=uncultured Sunxiuqinia sp. TaxID=1573825 RepID=UPI0019B78B47|nr:hypothetical protein [Sunxiuqinia sp.]|tara:strand:+ start:4309 stop:4695 length:387 start_codon:yes stop_codon:yes gene_type:complete
MQKHINIVAAIQIGFSIFGILFALLIYAILHLVGDFTDEPEANLVLSIIANVVATVFVILAIPGIIGGFGLFKRKEWARILVLILSVLDLFHFPVGTAVGVYSIWALVQPDVVAEFGKKPMEDPINNG